MSVCRASIRVETANPEHLARALEPDNIQAPSHVRVSCRALEGAVECVVEVDGCEDPKRVLTLRNTVDEIITMARTVEEVLSSVTGAGNTL